REVVFTSGGTESNNLALRGALAFAPGGEQAPAVLVTTRVEHSAVREPAAAMGKAGVKVMMVETDRDGYVSAEAVEAALRGIEGRATVVVSVQWANNETGVLQPVAAIAVVVERLRAEARADGTNHGSTYTFHA